MYSAIPGMTGVLALRECTTKMAKTAKTKSAIHAMTNCYTSGTMCSAKAGFLLRPNRTACERDLKTSNRLGRERRKNQRHHFGRRTADIY